MPRRVVLSGGGGFRLTAIAVALLTVTGCGAGTSVPSPTPDVLDKGECIDLSGPDDDITMTVVDCAAAQYEILEIIRLLVSKAPCPPETHLELERRVQFLRPGQTAGPSGGFQTETYCLRDLALPAATAKVTTPPLPSPTEVTQAEVEARDVRYTSKTGRGDPMSVTLTLDNVGDGGSLPISFQISGLAGHADIVKCTPVCEVETVSATWTLQFTDGIAAGASRDYKVELTATRAGSVDWRLRVFAGPENQVFTGTGTTEIE